MIVDKDGKIFEERRVEDRRKIVKAVQEERRKGERRKNQTDARKN